MHKLEYGGRRKREIRRRSASIVVPGGSFHKKAKTAGRACAVAQSRRKGGCTYTHTLCTRKITGSLAGHGEDELRQRLDVPLLATAAAMAEAAVANAAVDTAAAVVATAAFFLSSLLHFPLAHLRSLVLKKTV